MIDAPSKREDGRITVYQSNVKMVFDGDGWKASDIGDHSNWETGEAACGRFPQPPGAILGAIPFRDYVLAWKRDAVYRGRYVGHCVKWTWDISVGEVPEAWWPNAARWKCNYCGSTHPAGVERCRSCGAHRK